jgi:hypothetical protein
VTKRNGPQPSEQPTDVDSDTGPVVGSDSGSAAAIVTGGLTLAGVAATILQFTSTIGLTGWRALAIALAGVGLLQILLYWELRTRWRRNLRRRPNLTLPGPKRVILAIGILLSIVAALLAVTIPGGLYGGPDSPHGAAFPSSGSTFTRTPEPTTPAPSPTETTSTAGPTGSNSPPSDQIRWADLESFRPTGPTLYEQSFADPAPAWPTGDSDTYELTLQDGILRLHPLAKNEGVTVTAPAPLNTHQSDLVVSATATLSSGQGFWGVWCRGVDTTPSNAYYFEISHTAAVRILVLDGSQFGSGTGWFYLDGVDASQPTTISARCDDVPGAPIELTMAVNGRTALRYRVANQDPVLGPGFSGISARTFSDVEGTTADVRVSKVNLRKFQ